MPNSKPPSVAEFNQAVDVIKSGGVIAYPTEAVFGLGCDPLNETALKKILQLKQRAENKGFIIIAANFQQIEPYILPLTSAQKDRVMSTWPGPFTWLIPAAKHLSKFLTQNQMIAIRITNHPIAKTLCEKSQQAIVSTSANISGKAPLKTTHDIKTLFHDKLDYILPGEVGGLSQPTPIRDLTTLHWIRR